MPGAIVPQLPPQLPPLPAQPSLATPAVWDLRYSPEETNPSSTSVPDFATTNGSLKRSNSTSPRPRHNTTQSATDASSRPLGAVPFPTSRTKPRSHSHTRSNSRVPIPVLPSASSSELKIVPPFRTHSRTTSLGLAKPPTARPSTAEKEKEKEKAMDELRSLVKGPKHAPPQLSLPVREHSLSHSHPPVITVATSTISFPESTPSTTSTSSTDPTPPAKPFSVPAGAVIHRSQSLSHSSDTPPAAPASPPHSAPVALPGSQERALERKKLREQREKHLVFVMSNPDHSFLEHQGPDAAPHPPPRAPTPPKPRTIAQSPPQLVRNKMLPSSWKDPENPRSQSPPSHGRILEVAMAIRTIPDADADGRQSPAPRQRPSEGVARKWVLEKRGKRLTQDTMVVAQQLRMLR